jgi:hypothetical protein
LGNNLRARLLQRRKHCLADLRDNMHLRIDHLGDIVTDGCPQNDIRFVGRQLVIVFQPARKLGRGLLQRILQ